VRVNPNPNVIDRENDSRYIDVAAMVGKADLAAVDRPCAPPSARSSCRKAIRSRSSASTPSARRRRAGS
jgi:hypothetical protein